MQRVCMIGVERKSLAAAQLSIEVSSVLHVGKTGFIERRRATCLQRVNCFCATRD